MSEFVAVDGSATVQIGLGNLVWFGAVSTLATFTTPRTALAKVHGTQRRGWLFGETWLAGCTFLSVGIFCCLPLMIRLTQSADVV